jgi:phospholipase C
VISPWTVGGWVCSEPYDHTSVLRFLERFTGVREPNISAWRRQTFGDLTRPLRFDQTDDAPPALPGTKELLARAEYATAHWPRPALPGTRQRFPVQEPGVRKRVR